MNRRLLSPFLVVAPVLAIAALTARPALARAAAADVGGGPPSAPHEVPSPPSLAPQTTPAQLSSALERAWMAGDASAVASLCDSAAVRIALKPGAPPATAPTLAALAFLIHDQLGVVTTQRFHVVRLETDTKRRTASATARWRAVFGGAQRAREVEVRLGARAVGENAWLLTEIRAND